MNKMKKLLSVLLAVVLAFSGLTVLGSAAKTEYKTVDNLNTLGAYSPYGQVTRLSLEERTSIILDALDNLLAKANINLGEVFSLNLLIAKFDLTINLTSVDNLCLTLDDAADLLSNGLVSLAMAIVNLGILEDVNLDPWATGMSRDGTAQYTILSELIEVISAQDAVIENVLGNGKIDLGIISLGDMSAIEKIIADIPGMVKSLIFPMLERKDDTLVDIKNLDTWGTGDGNVNIAVNTFVQNLFTDNRSTTTVKYDANGNMTSEHKGLPIVTTDPTTTTPTDTSLRYVYYKDADGKLWTCHIVDQAEADASVEDATIDDLTAYTYVKEEVPYELKEEVPGWADTPYTWQATDAWGNTWTLKYMNDDSPWLPSLKEAIDAGTVSIDLASDSISAGDLLYTFIPYVFQEMAPVVLNGSMKKILGGLFGVTYKYVGQAGSDEVNALADSSDVFFTQEQGEYLWEWSDYAVINGTHYYRFEDQVFVGDTSDANHYFSVINWDYEITDDFLNEFIPANDSDTSDRILLNLNDFLVKVVNTVIAESATWDYMDKTTTWTRPALATGGNENLIPNIKLVAQTFIKHAPEHIFGSDYATNERCYYNLLISDDNDTVLTGIAAQLVDMIMPSMYLPGASDLIASNAKVGAILAAVIREFAGELIAEYDYDALIYTDYGTTTDDPDKTFVDPEASGLLTEGSTASGYWFDVILTMGMDAGYEYISAFADMGEYPTYCAGTTGDGYGATGNTYAEG
ncbi:MAG: hypothetical protein IJZ16_09305, partial [Clostridia bacterium]|nr:hypothetical protein [Clostridia bacterium]